MKPNMIRLLVAANILVTCTWLGLAWTAYQQTWKAREWKRLYTTTSAQLDIATDRLHQVHLNDQTVRTLPFIPVMPIVHTNQLDIRSHEWTNSISTNGLKRDPSAFTTNTSYAVFETAQLQDLAFVLDSHWNIERLFELRTNGVPVVTILSTGEVKYDTNRVSDATRVFWRELMLHIQNNFNR